MAASTHAGTCQCCGAVQKVRGGRIVLHGYQRPGVGQIRGRCPAVGQPPYEISCDWIKDELPRMQRCCDDAAERSRALRAREIGYLLVTTRRGAWAPPQLVDYVAGVTELWLFEEANERLMLRAEAETRGCAATVARWTDLVDTWQLRPLLPA